MSPQISRAITRLYSRRWRERYGDELEALLQDLPLSPAVVADAVLQSMLSRRVMLAAIAAVFAITLAVLSSLLHAPTRGAALYGSRAVAVTACRTYSSVNRSGWASRNQCLD